MTIRPTTSPRSALAALIACVAAFALAAALPNPARADEGMWTFDNFPSAKVAQEHGFSPSRAWLDHVERASLRSSNCSASFVSPAGLVLTNHHCVLDCVKSLSTPKSDLVTNGFIAKRQEDEVQCPDFVLDQLVRIQDVTKTVQSALSGKTGAAAVAARRAVLARLESTCPRLPAVHCEVVSLYQGGVYALYHYTRYTDVRLVFAPEFDVAQFGGDPDNFNFPRYDFDVGVLRAYVDGKPAESRDYLRWSANGSRAGELVFASGDPGSTERQLTVSQLEFRRDVTYPQTLPPLAEGIGVLEEFSKRGVEQEREAHEPLFFLQNDFKELTGEHQALLDARFFGSKVAEERRLRAAVAARAALQRATGQAWDEVARLQPLRARIDVGFSAQQALVFSSALLAYAQQLVQVAAERTKPNGSRLPGYTENALPALQAQLTAPVPVFKDFEETELWLALSQMRQQMGADDPFVRRALGNESPEQAAHRLVSGTHLDDPAVRKALYDGGAAAIAASDDPMIRFAASIDPDMRATLKEFEDSIQAPTAAATQRISKARFAVYGTSVYPDATFTPRLTYGSVKGFEDARGRRVAPFTTIAGLYDRASGAPPYDLPKSWLDAKGSLDLNTPMNLSTDNDIIGGNSGSPLIDRNAEIVGLIFDGNIFSLGGNFGFDETNNRSVALDSRALLEVMRKVYHLERIVGEIEAARR